MKQNLCAESVKFNGEQCKVIEDAIKEVCRFRSYELRAVNARTNHVHAVISAQSKPEPIADAFKSYSTKRLRQTGLVGKDVRPWARGRSRRYLWKPKHVLRAIQYVMYKQGEPIPEFDD